MRTVTKRAGFERRTILRGLAAATAAPVIPLLGFDAPSIAHAATLALQPIAGRPPAADFSLLDIDGHTRTLSDYAGKVVVANFWATWCPPCCAEIPSMQRAWQKLESEGGVVLALHVGGDAEQIWAFLAEFGVTFPVLIDATGSVSNAWQTIGLPTTFVVDGQGRKALRAIGERDWSDPAILTQILALRQM